MKTYNIIGHKRGTHERMVAHAQAQTASAAKNKAPKNLVVEKVRLWESEGGKSRTKEQAARAGAAKHRNLFNRRAFGIK
jgi:hypothetical protein